MSSTRATSPGPGPSGNRRRPAEHGTEVPSITSAPVPLEEDQARRTRRYLLQMGIRVICFLGAIMVGDTWVRWALVVLAVVLPYSAVLFANAGRDRVSYDTSPVTDVGPAALPAPAPEDSDAAGPGAPGTGATGPGAGRVVEHRDDEETDPGSAPAGHDVTDRTSDQSPDQTPDQTDDREENR